MAKLLKCFDGVTPEAIPAAALVLGYVDGDYQTYQPLVERFKDSHTHVLSVTVTGTSGADLADCERGNIQPTQVAAWVESELKSGRHPGVYGSKDYIVACAAAIRARRIHPALVAWFLADYIQVAPSLDAVKWPEELPAGYVGWQFADSIRMNCHTIDASVVSQAYAREKGWGQTNLTPSTTTHQSVSPPPGRFLPSGWYLNAENAKKVG